jgi:hypothetical protein
LIRADPIFAFPRSTPPTPPSCECHLKLLHELCNLIALSRRYAYGASIFAKIRIIGMQDGHLPAMPPIFHFSHHQLPFMPQQFLYRSSMALGRLLRAWAATKEQQPCLGSNCGMLGGVSFSLTPLKCSLWRSGFLFQCVRNFDNFRWPKAWQQVQDDLPVGKSMIPQPFRQTSFVPNGAETLRASSMISSARRPVAKRG